MELSDRKQKILQAIIDEYIGTAEPVGSRAIAKHESLGLSSATIRNEMADLEEMGYLISPHTSAGRIPSDVGYRFYVNSLMQRYQMSVDAVEALRAELAQKVNQLDMIIKKASMITSSLTEYTTVITSPALRRAKIKKLDLLSLGNSNAMLIIVTQTGSVKNHMLAIDISDDNASKLSAILNEKLSDRTAEDITYESINDIAYDATSVINLSPKNIIEILHLIFEAIDSLDEREVYVNNAKSILQYPEFSDVGKAREMLSFLENKEKLISMMDKNPEKGVCIGTETGIAELENSSLITVDYKLGDKVLGKIGVIGPKRMNYAKVIASLDMISNHIDMILNQLYNTEGEG